MTITKNVFNFNGKDLSVLTDGDGNPWWIGREVCSVLGIFNVSDAVSSLDSDEKADIAINDTSSNGVTQRRNVLIINESGLYSLILRSKKQEAKLFKKWVTSEVIPSIRKHGAYMTPAKIEDILANPDLIIGLATELKRERAAKEEAIRTKAQISDKKTATAMATASHLSRENNKLREQIGDSKTYKAVKAIPWLADIFDMTNIGVYTAIGKQLTKISRDIGVETRKIDDSKFGMVNAYHIDAISKFRDSAAAGGRMAKYKK